MVEGLGNATVICFELYLLVARQQEKQDTFEGLRTGRHELNGLARTEHIVPDELVILLSRPSNYLCSFLR
jgi:hypothetical protein